LDFEEETEVGPEDDGLTPALAAGAGFFAEAEAVGEGDGTDLAVE
jgi:hypothetical protein